MPKSCPVFGHLVTSNFANFSSEDVYLQLKPAKVGSRFTHGGDQDA